MPYMVLAKVGKLFSTCREALLRNFAGDGIAVFQRRGIKSGACWQVLLLNMLVVLLWASIGAPPLPIPSAQKREWTCLCSSAADLLPRSRSLEDVWCLRTLGFQRIWATLKTNIRQIEVRASLFMQARVEQHFGRCACRY